MRGGRCPREMGLVVEGLEVGDGGFESLFLSMRLCDLGMAEGG